MQELDKKKSHSMINLHTKFGSFSGMMPSLFAPEYLDEVHVNIPELESQVIQLV
jgi:hypothetical protein